MRGVRGTFTENIIVDNVDGIDITGTNGSLIIGNQFESNMMAIVTDHGGFQLYHNNFINQTVRWDGAYSATVLLASHSSNDTFLTWDNGFPSGGNYWSDYTARYPNATEIDSLEIGDTTYVIGMHYAINSTKVNTYIVQAVDRYPLLTPVDIPKATTAMPSRSPSATPTLNQSQPPTPSQSTPPQPTHTPSPSYTLQLTAPPNEEMELAPEYIFALAGVGMAVAAAIVALLKRKQQ
jgi:parallel beta-helix repeat protein